MKQDATVALTNAGYDHVDRIIERNLSVPCPICSAVADAFCDGRVAGDWFGGPLKVPEDARSDPFPVHRARFKLGRERAGLK